ncbi:MAG: DUF86 domain-containing protein [Elusimicrobiota bacterium]
MFKRSEKEFLKDIIEAIEKIKSYTENKEYDEFLRDMKTQDAVVRNIEIIGEATKNISTDFKKKYKNIEWKNMAGMRDKIIHFYFGVKWEIVWSVIKNEIPLLKEKIEKIIK